jgi:DNA-directed RNA polymerase specialized sigma24 family protein
MKENFMSNDSSFPFRFDQHYRALRTKLVTYFDRRRCPSSDDLADETLGRLIKIAASREVGNLDATAFAIAKNVFHEWLRQSGRFSPLDDEPGADPPPGSETSRFIAQTVIRELNSAERDFLEEYFIEGKRAKDLASEMGTTAIAVRGRIFRLRQRLEESVGQLLARGAPASGLSRSPIV